MKNFNCCNNRHKESTLKYCAYCGAPQQEEKLTFLILFNHFLSVFNYDSKLLVTVKYLILRPHNLIENYINGRSKAYINPISLVVLSGSIYQLLIKFVYPEDTGVELINSFCYFLSTFLIFLPLVSSATTFISKDSNFLENFVANSFILGFINIIQLLVFLLFQILGFLDLSNLYEFFLFFVLAYLYLTYAYYKVLKINVLISFLFSFIAFNFSYILSILAALLLTDFDLKDFAP